MDFLEIWYATAYQHSLLLRSNVEVQRKKSLAEEIIVEGVNNSAKRLATHGINMRQANHFLS